MDMKWWGTVNLPAVVAARCMIHAITGLARADSRLMVRLLTWRIGRRGGGGVGGELVHARGRNAALYTAMGGSLASTRDIGGIPRNSAVILSSTRRRRPWVLACTRRKTCNQHNLTHENGSDRDALEGGRELGGFSKRQAVMGDMAKWGSGEASGAPEFPLAIDQIGMGGVRTIELDDLRGLLRLVRRSVAAYLRDDRR